MYGSPLGPSSTGIKNSRMPLIFFQANLVFLVAADIFSGKPCFLGGR
jgi:hypothetical protein